MAEMAEYTGAGDRVALGKKAKKEESKRRRAGMVEMIDDVCVVRFPTIIHHLSNN